MDQKNKDETETVDYTKCERCQKGDQEVELGDGSYVCSDCYGHIVSAAHDWAKAAKYGGDY